MSNKKFKVLILLLIFFLLSLGLLFSSRGWIRETFIPNFVAKPTKNSLVDSYQNSYKKALPFIEDLGISLSTDVEGGCRLASAENISTTVFCFANSGGEFHPDNEYKELFRNESARIEKELIANGWTKTWNENQPINELFDNSENEYSIGVNYEIGDPKKCILSLSYNAWQEPDNFKYFLACTENKTFL